jgi:hypothetical protein
MNVRVRGIYTTALTRLLAETDGASVVQASPAIGDRFDADFAAERADATVETADDRQGVSVAGDPSAVERVADLLEDVGTDTFVWAASVPEGGVFDGVVTETLGGGAVVDLGETEGYLPYGNVDDHVTAGDHLRVQVREGVAPWSGGRPVLDTTVAVGGELATLSRGETVRTSSHPEMGDLLPTDPPEGWLLQWGRAADDAGLDDLDGALSAAAGRAAAIEDSLAEVDPPGERAPAPVWTDAATVWAWFGRESRFALDEARRAVTPTMAGHHRVKAGDERASAAVDFVEAVCPDATSEFPFDAVTRQFGPTEGDSVSIGHGKPDGRCLSLGSAEVVERDPDGKVVVRRELSPGGTYDALGTPIEAGDVAETTLTEGKWWYPTIYRDADGTSKGTYVNVCTPVEVFPGQVRYVDLHVDVVKHADGTVERVDDDELDAAVADGLVAPALAEKARSVAAAVERALS